MNKLLVSMLAILLTIPLSTLAVDPASDESPATKTETEKAAAEAKPGEPITGAFGITLGKPFSPAMVARVLDRQEKSYRGPDGAERTGSLIRIEPSQPDKRFLNYSLKTSDKGIVYAIEAEYQMELERDRPNPDQAKRSRKIRKTCKTAVKNLAKELEDRHGKPRAAGLHDEWFAFRQFSESSNKGIDLYANQCRTGKYRVIYTDLTAIHEKKVMPSGQ
jgi:mRNA-degrading endonuclease RelE of RelBE toxin-antitoxin system